MDIESCLPGRAVASEAGRVWTNCYHVYPAGAAFGGYKASGIGREKSQDDARPLPADEESAGLLLAQRHGVLLNVSDVLNRVSYTEEAAQWLRRLTDRHGPLMFHQSGGCCDGSSPMCYPNGDFITSEADILLGELDVAELDQPIPFWMSVTQYEYWKHTHLTVDVVPGRGSGFSVEAPEGVRFLIRSRLLTDAESEAFGLL